jgi:hypothetical protein
MKSTATYKRFLSAAVIIHAPRTVKIGVLDKIKPALKQDMAVSY